MMLRIVTQKVIRYYITANGHVPVIRWLEGLADSALRHRIEVRVNRMKLGLMGDWKAVGNGVFELRLSFGPGYRIYFAFDGDEILLLLCAGDKSTQTGDIARARGYWKEYKECQYGKKE